jgi:hypothetical protein
MEYKMATKQTDGLSDVTSASTDNNGGTIKANGAVSGTFQATATTLEKTGVFGSTVVDNDSADKALSSGTFAYDNERPVAKKTTTTLAGVAEDFLQSGAAAPSTRRSIHKIESVRTRKLTTAIRTNKWNEYSGEFDSGYPETSTDSFGTDDAANPTRNVPGELTYIAGNDNTILVPKNDDYKSRTN